MPTIQQLEEGIRLADQAGDANAVRALGAELIKMRQSQPAQTLTALPTEDLNKLQTPLGNVDDLNQQAAQVVAPVFRGSMPALTNMAAGAGLGFLVGGPPGAVAGAGMAGLATMIGDPLVVGVNKLFGTRMSTPTEAWAQIMDKIGVPESSTEGQKLIEAISRGGASALSGVGAGTILQQMGSPVARAIGAALASGPVEQIAAGAAAGGAGELSRAGAEQLGFGETGQAVANLAGGLVGGVAGASLAAPKTRIPLGADIPGMTPQVVQQTIQEAEDAGRSVFTSDIFRPKTWAGRRLQDVSEGTFFGTAAARQAQQSQRLQMIDDVLANFGAAADRELAYDIAQNARAFRDNRIDYWSGIKNEIVDRVSANNSNLKSPELSRTFTTIAEEVKALEKTNPEAYRPLINKLMDFGKGLLGEPILDASGNIVDRTGITLKAAEENLKIVGSMLAKDPTLAHVKSTFEKSANQIYGALKEDVKAFILNAEGNNSVNQYNRANARLYSGIKELESDSLRLLLKKGDVKPEVVDRMLFSGKPSEMRLLYANLDANGKRLVRGAILSKAASQSVDKDGVISTAKFATQLSKLNKQIGVAFQHDDRRAVEGLANYLRLTRRAEQFNVDPNTGARMFMPLLGGALGAKLGATGAIAGASLFGVAAQLFESQATRSLLSALPRLQNNSQEQMAVVNRITQAINSSISNIEAEKNRNKQFTFLPENIKAEQLPIGGVLTDTATGYRMVSRGGTKIGLYGPDNKQIGIFSSQEDARKRAEKELRKRK